MFENIDIEETNKLFSTETEKQTKVKYKNEIKIFNIEDSYGFTFVLKRRASSHTLVLTIKRMLNEKEEELFKRGNISGYYEMFTDIISRIPLNIGINPYKSTPKLNWLIPNAVMVRMIELTAHVYIDADAFCSAAYAMESLEEYVNSVNGILIIKNGTLEYLTKRKNKLDTMLTKTERYIKDPQGIALLQNMGTIVEAEVARDKRATTHPIDLLMIQDNYSNSRGNQLITLYSMTSLRIGKSGLSMMSNIQGMGQAFVEPTNYTNEYMQAIFRGREYNTSQLNARNAMFPITRQFILNTVAQEGYQFKLESTNQEYVISTAAAYCNEIWFDAENGKMNPLGLTRKRSIPLNSTRTYVDASDEFIRAFATLICELNNEGINDISERMNVEEATHPINRQMYHVVHLTRKILTGMDQLYCYLESKEEWKTLYKKHSLFKRSETAVNTYKKVLSFDEKLGSALWNSQLEDIAAISVKNRVILQSSVGSGKTRVIILSQLMNNKGNNLTLVEPSLVNEFLNEFDNLKVHRPVVVKSEKQLELLSDYNIAGYTAMSKEISDPFLRHKINKRLLIGDKPLLHMYMDDKFNFICVDESHNVKNNKSNRYKYLNTLKSDKLMLCSGTMTTGDPKDVFNQVALLTNTGPASLMYAYTRTGIQKFNYKSLYGVLLKRMSVGSSKRIDTISDSRTWCHLFDSYIIYTDKQSPKVSESVTFKTAEVKKRYSDPDKEHMSLFVSNIYKFDSWLKATDKEEKTETKILAKMTLLSQINNCPQMDKVINRTEYSYSGLTVKQQDLVKLIDSYVSKSEQIIVFVASNEVGHHLTEIITKHSENMAIPIDVCGKPIKVKNKLIDQFKNGAADVIVGTYKGMGKGYNIPQASVVICFELFWTPDIMTQAVGRILREQQRKDPKLYLMISKGMIDEYQIDELVFAREFNSDIMVNGSTNKSLTRVRSYREVAEEMCRIILEKENESNNQNT